MQSSMAVVDRLDVSLHDDAWQMSIKYDTIVLISFVSGW
jgi:hypothetical protein